MAADDNPQQTVTYMLGKLDGKLDALKQSVDQSATSQGTFNAAMQTKIEAVEKIATDNASDIKVLQALRPIKHGWPILWGTVASVALAAFTIIYSLIH